MTVCNCSAEECAEKRKKSFHTAVACNMFSLQHTGGHKKDEEVKPLGLPVLNFDEDKEPVTANAGDDTPLGTPDWKF